MYASSGSYTYNGSPVCPLQGETLGSISYPNFPATGAQPSTTICPSLLPKPTPTTPATATTAIPRWPGRHARLPVIFNSSSAPGPERILCLGKKHDRHVLPGHLAVRPGQGRREAGDHEPCRRTTWSTVNNLNVGIFWFADVLNQVYPSSGEAGNDWTTAIADVGGPASVANGADTGIPPYVGANGGNTDFTSVMSSLASTLTAAGTGASAASPHKVLFIVTDGLNDPASRAIAAFDPSACTQFKSKGYTIYVLYTPYYDLMNGYYLNGTNPSAASIVHAAATASDSIPYNLQQCATSASTYLEASDSAGITAALQTFLTQALNTPAKFTQ